MPERRRNGAAAEFARAVDVGILRNSRSERISKSYISIIGRAFFSVCDSSPTL